MSYEGAWRPSRFDIEVTTSLRLRAA